MNPLMHALSSWRGRRFVQDALEARGFILPRIYQEVVKEACGIGQTSSLDTYWDEIAKEYVHCAGRVLSVRRRFAGDAEKSGYRSAYLDQLAERFDYGAAKVAAPPIHPCLYRLFLEVRQGADSEFARELDARVSREELAELAMLRGQEWRAIETKAAAREIFERALEERGFTSRHHRFTYVSASGLVFESGVDVGGRPTLVDNPIYLFVHHVDDAAFICELSNFERFVPGISRYSLYRDPHLATLGVLAHAEYVDIFVHSFGE